MAKKKESETKTKKTAKKSTAVASNTKKVAAKKTPAKKTPAKKTSAKKSSKEDSLADVMHQDEHLDVKAAGLMLDMLDEELDAGEKKFGISSTLLDPNEPKISTGLLSLDLILFGGLRSGGWYTVFGGEQSAKSTLITWLSAAMIKIGFHKQGRGAWFDCEGSSDPVYINNIMQNMGITKKDATDIFGVRDPETGEYLKKPLIRFYQEDNGQVVFDMLNKFKRSLPTIEKQGKEYYYILDNTNPNKAKFKGMYDVKYLTKHNKLKIPGAPATPQAIVLMDSYVAMLPEGLDKDDANGSMAIQARMFSDGIKRVKGGMRKKRMIVFGVNQLRLRPAVMNQNPEYEPGGEALKFFSDVRLRAVARAHSGAPWSWDGLNSQIIQEESKTGEGKDTYRFINITTQKNKLGGTPSQQTWLRLWVADEHGQARGFCPVFDTFYYLYSLGLVSGTKNNMKFHSSVPLHGAKKCSWNKFKRLVLGTNAEIKEVCEELGLEKAGNIRKWCFTHIQKAGMKRYRDVLAGKASDDDESKDDSE